MKDSKRVFLLTCLGLLLSLVFVSCDTCRETVCQECIAWDADGREVYYGELCHVDKSERRRNERKAENAANDNNGKFQCTELVTTTGCNN